MSNGNLIAFDSGPEEVLMLDVGQLELNVVVVPDGAPILDNNNNVYPKHCKIITKFICVH